MGWLDRVTDRSARRWLSTVGTQLASGWIALAEGFLPKSTFESHVEGAANAVRCELDLAQTTFDPDHQLNALVLLAGHAYDVQTGAIRNGWQPPQQLEQWTPAEWTGIRLLACYLLAARQPRGPRMPLVSADIYVPDLMISH